MSYQPPTHGAPCWVLIPATNVARGKEFYSKVFDWKFEGQEPDYPVDEVAMFKFPDPAFSMLGGGIVKHEEEKIKRPGVGAVVVYLYVNSIEETLEKIKAAGGKAVGTKDPEGKNGWTQIFEDTEGNVGGMWTMRKESDA